MEPQQETASCAGSLRGNHSSRQEGRTSICSSLIITIWEFLSLVISCESLHTAELFYLEMLLTGEVDGKDGKKENKRIEVTTDCSERRV